MKRRTCFFASFAAIITLLCVLVAFCVPALAADHDCKGDNCEICALIALCRSIVIAACAAAVFSALYSVKTAGGFAFTGVSGENRRSPVTLKVRLLS